MKATIFCTFESVDLAELAVGKLREKIAEISDVEITRPNFSDPEDDGGFIPFLGGINGVAVPSGTLVGPVAVPVTDVEGGEDAEREESDFIPHSATLRLTCPKDLRRDVEAQLINLGALGLRAVDGAPDAR